VRFYLEEHIYMYGRFLEEAVWTRLRDLV